METLQQDDLDLKDGIAAIALMNDYVPVMQIIAQNIHDNGLDIKNRDLILKQHSIEKIEHLKDYALFLIIDYIKLVLNDYAISEKERENVTFLKYYFKIKEGDFYKDRYDEVVKVLNRQFEKIYEDGIVTNEEAIHKFEVQDLFDLSHDQFFEIKENYLSKQNET